jgi:hypothetical protein
MSKSCESGTACIVGRKEEEWSVKRRCLGRRRVVNDGIGGGKSGLAIGEERVVGSKLERPFCSACRLVATARHDGKS